MKIAMVKAAAKAKQMQTQQEQGTSISDCNTNVLHYYEL